MEDTTGVAVAGASGPSGSGIQNRAVVKLVNVDLGYLNSLEDIINFLLKNPFSRLNYDEKLHIVPNITRPIPDLSKLLVKANTIGKSSSRGFNNDWYSKFDWLAGSAELKRLFCWPCVLFATQSNSSVWSKTGFDDLKNLSRGLSFHDKSLAHIDSKCKFFIMKKQNIATVIDTARKIELENFNAKVKENREIIRSLIFVTMHLCMQEQPFRGHDESADSLNRGNFREELSLVSRKDFHLKKFLEKDNDTRSVFSGTSKTIQNELIDSVAFTLNTKIANEIKNSTFFSWQVDESTDINCHSQLSVIFFDIF